MLMLLWISKLNIPNCINDRKFVSLEHKDRVPLYGSVYIYKCGCKLNFSHHPINRKLLHKNHRRYCAGRGHIHSTKKKLFDHNKTDRNLQTGELPSLANNFGSRTPPVCCCSTEYTEEFGTDFLGQRKNQIIVEDRMVEALHHPDLYMMLDLAIWWWSSGRWKAKCVVQSAFNSCLADDLTDFGRTLNTRLAAAKHFCPRRFAKRLRGTFVFRHISIGEMPNLIAAIGCSYICAIRSL